MDRLRNGLVLASDYSVPACGFVGSEGIEGFAFVGQLLLLDWPQVGVLVFGFSNVQHLKFPESIPPRYSEDRFT